MTSTTSLRIVFRVLISYWPRHKLQCALCLLGIALGVAVVTAMDLANSSALASFRESIATVSGKATHQIIPREGSYQNGVPESIFPKVLATPGVTAAAPMIETYGTLVASADAALPDSPLESARRAEASAAKGAPELVRILGIEPLLDRPFRSAPGVKSDLSAGMFAQWMLRDDGCALSAALADRLGVKAGDTLTLLNSGRRHALRLLAVYSSGEKLAQDDILLIDISAAQERFGTLGRLSSIDLILPDGAEGDAAAEKLRALLPDGIVLQRPSERASRTEALLQAFQLNLRALSMLALVVGIFLVYNTLTVAVLQRTAIVGTLRCLGASGADTRRAVLLESLVLGAIGSVLGLLAGAALARLFLERVGGIVSDLYAHVGTLAVFYDSTALVKGLALGMLASAAGAFVPALETGRIAPTNVLRRSGTEAWAQRSWKKLLFCALLSFAAALGLALVPGKSPLPGLGAAFALSMGGALAAPAVTRAISLRAADAMRRVFGVPGMLAARGLGANLSRTGLAVGALGMALSMTLGVALMVASFRSTLDHWMQQSLLADVYIRPAGPALLRRHAHVPPELIAQLRALPEVEALDTFTGRDVVLADGTLALVSATDTQVTFSRGREHFPLTPDGGDVERAFAGLRGGQALVSESLARKQGLRLGDALALPGAKVQTPLRIEGIYHEYATDRGVISVDRGTYETLFGDAEAQSVSLYVKPAANLDALLKTLREKFGAPSGLYVFSNRTLREEAFRVFDRTFAITDQLESLSLAAGLCGILSALLALLRERSAEYGLLRALGMTARGLFALVVLEGTLLGVAAFGIACVLGPALALLLIQVINVRAFGWTILFSMRWEVFLRTGLLTLLLSAAAAIYPAIRGRVLSAAAALREE